MSMTMVDFTAIMLTALIATALILAITRQTQTRHQKQRGTTQFENSFGPIFLFNARVLVDANKDAAALIANRPGNTTDFDAMVNALAVRFPKIDQMISEHTSGQLRIHSHADPSHWVDLEQAETTLRVTLSNQISPEKPSLGHMLAHDIYDAEIALLRDVSKHTPQLIWQEDSNGKLRWANDAYIDFFNVRPGNNSQQPLMFFPNLNKELYNQRISTIRDGDENEHWFDITIVKRDGGLLYFAAGADDVMRADKDRQNFVKTLGKTFAQLSIGLAIFDKNRQLAMFNPALIDMTKLPVDFLSARPTIDTVLDRLRELRMMPEPKDYTTWRERFTAVETAAKNGTYSENWTLSDGQTFRVTGRPHPDGAFAFLFEDISAEISLTRRFRADIETSQAVLDSLPNAIAVFSTSGNLVITNKAYAKLWSTNPELLLEHRELRTEIAVWQKHCIPSPIWDQMRDFMQQLGVRKQWSDHAMLDDGRHLECVAKPISGAMTMVQFTIALPKRPNMRKISHTHTMIHSNKR